MIKVKAKLLIVESCDDTQIDKSVRILLIRYYTGDLVNVTCYSRGSSPPANLHWKVNNERVFDEVADMEQYR